MTEKIAISTSKVEQMVQNGVAQRLAAGRHPRDVVQDLVGFSDRIGDMSRKAEPAWTEAQEQWHRLFRRPDFSFYDEIYNKPNSPAAEVRDYADRFFKDQMKRNMASATAMHNATSLLRTGQGVKTAFLSPQISQALRAAAPGMAAGAGVGALGGALAAGEGRRLEGALGGAAVGAAGGGAISHFKPQLQAAAQKVQGHIPGAPGTVPHAPSEATLDALNDIRGLRNAPVPPPVPKTPADAQAYATLGRLDRMLGKAASYEAGYADVLESMCFRKEANIGALLQGLRAAAPRVGAQVGEMAGMGAARLGNAARGGWGAFAQAAPRTAKGLQMAGNVAMHPATQFGTMMAPVVKEAL